MTARFLVGDVFDRRISEKDVHDLVAVLRNPGSQG